MNILQLPSDPASTNKNMPIRYMFPDPTHNDLSWADSLNTAMQAARRETRPWSSHKEPVLKRSQQAFWLLSRTANDLRLKDADTHS